MSEMKTYINPKAIKSNSIGTTHLNDSVVTKINTAYNLANIFKPSGILWGSYYGNSNLNDFTNFGTYKITGIKEADDNFPIYNNGGKIEAILTVIYSTDECVSQVLTLLNCAGGDTNLYTRTRQNGVWSIWGKLQSNIEVGLIGINQAKTFNDFIDNGIYSGVNLYWENPTTYQTGAETFVLIVINGYLYGSGISQLKYSIKTNNTTSIQIRNRINDTWSSWTDICENTTSEITINGNNNNGVISLTLQPNVYYKILNVTNLTIDFTEPKNGILNNYMFEVTFGNGNTITLPNAIKWANGNTPVCKANCSYQISVINNLGVFTEYK
jgi:hypothetical protein